jgi:hypothetical protein
MERNLAKDQSFIGAKCPRDNSNITFRPFGAEKTLTLVIYKHSAPLELKPCCGEVVHIRSVQTLRLRRWRRC